MMFTGAVYGLAIGAVLGLTGAGGVMAVPALMLGLGLTLHDAAPISLIAVSSAAAIGAVTALRRGHVRYRAAIAMSLAGAVGAPIGAHLAHEMPQRWLTFIFCGVMLFVAVRMIAQVLGNANQREQSSKNLLCQVNPETGRFHWTAGCAASMASIGASAGLFTGMLGVGGGFVIVPALRQFSDLPMVGVTATSLAVVALVSSFTVVGSLLGGAHIASVGWVFTGAMVVGLAGGRIATHRLPWQWVQSVFALLVLSVAVLWLKQTFA
ncbi:MULTISPECIES: sulfite exporter TauE/SafE family protein [Paraburkholderia]|uniref:sulfite exporter TauE/SafE family protein n=1 Tax=Paraburkholderia TaxID=1822464 RepID=UPI002AB6BB50|nr:MULTISPECIES: sulfite exporter TauE/SafE family protein [Paraburkholderia]